jgi:4-amino-4-deoxy-L-arabinose transferase-like glycosyltransferase
VSDLHSPTPAIVSQLAARRFPRWILLLLGLIYVLPGLLGRQPWSGPDLASFGVMLDMAQGSGDWLQPQVLGERAAVQAWLPYWLGAASIELLPFLPADLAARLPYGLLLALALHWTWLATYHLARLPNAQPVAFAFGGEASPQDYARALADAALLALIASLGLAQLAHESTPDAAQLAFAALLLYACARLASPNAQWRGLSAAAWWLGAVGLALSGAPWIGLVLGMGWLLWSLVMVRSNPRGVGNVWLLAFCASGTLLAALLAWQLELPRRFEQLSDWAAWTDLAHWRRFGRLLLWFSWPAGLLALLTVWRWRRRLGNTHLLLPLWFAAVGTASCWLLDASDRALLLALPALACLAAFALPTLSRSVTALVDWFALLFFSGCALLIWFYWLALQTGLPPKPAANVLRLLPGFKPELDWTLLLAALVGTLAWLGALAWRLGRYRPALWKGLVLSAGGSTLCWLLLMTLWLPALNYGMGQEPISRRIAALTPRSSCVLVHGLNASQITGLQYHGGLELERARRQQRSSCQLLVVEPKALDTLAQTVDLAQWRALRKVPRLRENRDGLLVYLRR